MQQGATESNVEALNASTYTVMNVFRITSLTSVAQKVERFIYQTEGWWFNLLQTACLSVFLGLLKVNPKLPPIHSTGV